MYRQMTQQDGGLRDDRPSNTPVGATNPPHCDNLRPQRSHRLPIYLQDFEMF